MTIEDESVHKLIIIICEISNINLWFWNTKVLFSIGGNTCDHLGHGWLLKVALFPDESALRCLHEKQDGYDVKFNINDENNIKKPTHRDIIRRSRTQFNNNINLSKGLSTLRSNTLGSQNFKRSSLLKSTLNSQNNYLD